MQKSKKVVVLPFVFTVLLFFTGFAPVPFDIEIDVSPNVLNLNNQGEVVTVHTDISYGLVVGSSVYLNGIEINHWKADNQGNFVAKFLIEEVKALDLNIGGLNTLTMVGETIAGIEFVGSQDIKVINVLPAGKR